MIKNAEITFRVAEPATANADALARLHAESWQAAYRGVLPADYLNDAAVADRQAHWRRVAAALGTNDVLVVAEVAPRVVGMALWKARPEAGFTHHLDTCLVHPAIRGGGVGTTLLRRAAQRAAETSGRGLYVWVLDGNLAAFNFYRSLGGEPADRGLATLLGGEVPQTRIVWPDLSLLVERCDQRIADQERRKKRQ